jgi:hypothetical protein
VVRRSSLSRSWGGRHLPTIDPEAFETNVRELKTMIDMLRKNTRVPFVEQPVLAQTVAPGNERRDKGVRLREWDGEEGQTDGHMAKLDLLPLCKW